MMHFTIAGKKKTVWWSILFWLFVWEAASKMMGQEILLASPVTVMIRLMVLCRHMEFWFAVWFSFRRIAIGFFLSAAAGTFFAIAAFRFKLVEELLSPLMITIKSIPVVSFIILVLVWFSSRNLSVLISFLMGFPVIYTNILQGIQNVDSKLLEMSMVFQAPFWKKIRFLYFPQVFPYFRSACMISIGLCWKSGVAAEVIGIPNGSIGEQLYNAKIYLETADLFAWTIVIIFLSAGFEKLLIGMITLLEKWNEGGI